MICKDDDVCPSCLLRRKKKDCGYEPYGWGPDQDGEYGIGCPGQISKVMIAGENLNDSLAYYHGIGEPIPMDLLFPIFVWSGFNWLNDEYACGWYIQQE